MDVAVIMDRSGSVGEKNFEKAKEFVISLVHKLQISSHGTRIGIIPYHSEAQVAVKFADVAHQTPDAMTKLIKGIPYTSGMTRTDVAIELANNQLFTDAGGQRSDKPNVLIVMTDGHTNPGSKPYKTVLAPLKVGCFLSHSISAAVIFGSSLGIFGDLRQCSRESLHIFRKSVPSIRESLLSGIFSNFPPTDKFQQPIPPFQYWRMVKCITCVN